MTFIDHAGYPQTNRASMRAACNLIAPRSATSLSPLFFRGFRVLFFTPLRFPLFVLLAPARNGLHFRQAHENNEFPAPSWSRSLLLRPLQ
jgi:hypothetical protein